MKVVHSFVDSYNCLWKELAYSQYLSAVLAKEHYGNISFYSTPEIVKQVRDLGMEYDDYNESVVTISDHDTWSLPKLKTFRDMDEPFLHLDNDTFIIDKIEFDKKYTFSHLDTGFKKIKVDLQEGFDGIINSVNYSKGEKDFYTQYNETYLRLFFKLLDKTPDVVIDNFHFSSIPNMNITYVEDPVTFGRAVDVSLEHYYNNKKLIDSEKYGPCYVEQLMVHQALRGLDNDYKKLSKKYQHVLFKNLPYANLDDYNNTPKFEDMTLPFRSRIYTSCECCGVKTKQKIVLENIEDIIKFLDYEFDGFVHTTYMKWYDIFQAWTIHQLRKRVGDQAVLNIHRYFHDIYTKLNLPTTSTGEEFYGKISDFSFK